MEVGRIDPKLYRRKTEQPRGRNCRMEESRRKAGLLGSIWEDTERTERLLRKKASQTEAACNRDFIMPNWAVFLVRHGLRFAKFRLHLTVTEYILFHDSLCGESIYYVCPRCGITLDREYQAFCDRCGQRLDWKEIDKAKCRQLTLKGSANNRP